MARSGALGRAEAAREVGPEVVGVFEPDGDAEQAVGDAARRAGFGGDDAVREPGRVLDERVRRAEADGGCHQPDRAEERRRRVVPALDFEGEDRARAAHLPAKHVAVVPEAGVVHRRHGGVRGEPCDEPLRRRLRPFDAERERREAAVEEVRRERVEQRARGDADLPQPPRPRLVRRHDAGDHVAVAAEEFRRAVEHERRAMFERPLQYGRRERRVHEDRHAARLRHDVLDIDEAERRVRRRLDHDERRLGPDRVAHRVRRRPTSRRGRGARC